MIVSAIIGSIICVLCIIISIIKERRLFSPLVVFSATWLVILLFSSWNLYGHIYSARDRVYNWILLGIVFFALGYLGAMFLIGKKRVVLIYGNKRLSAEKTIPRYKLLYALCLITIVIFAKDFVIISRQILASFNLHSVQQLRTAEDVAIERNSIENALVLLIIEPFSAIIVAVTAVDFFLGNKDKRLLSYTLVIMLLRIVSSGGRSIAIQFLLFLCIAYTVMCSREGKNLINRKRLLKQKRIMRIMLVLGIIFLALLTYSRAGKYAVKTIYADFAMQPYMLDYWATYVEERNLYGYGMASFNGFVHILTYLLKNILGIEFPMGIVNTVIDTITLTNTNWIMIGERTTANAYVTGFWFLYYDFRLVGIAVGMFLLGMVSQRIYYNAYRTFSQKAVCKYLFIVMLVFYTFCRFQLAFYRYAIGLLLIYFVVYKKADSGKYEEDL